ncbi:MAG: hypothetical protein H6935_01625 [Thiobacillus sp.]|nr:hypothetical protein [Thiobacillus sp.]
MNLLIAVFFSVGLVACAALETKGWGQWAEENLALHDTTSTALFDWRDWPGMIVRIDKNPAVSEGYKSARLRPGVHVIEYSNHVRDFGHVKGVINMVLLAGHSYQFHFDTCYWCKPRRLAVWVDDVTTGELAWGTRPNWPRWYL